MQSYCQKINGIDYWKSIHGIILLWNRLELGHYH